MGVGCDQAKRKEEEVKEEEMEKKEAVEKWEENTRKRAWRSRRRKRREQDDDGLTRKVLRTRFPNQKCDWPCVPVFRHLERGAISRENLPVVPGNFGGNRSFTRVLQP